ncbi:VanW family protein [Eubacteriales bacterium OttesenSCG-928-M02]|nr:VanW family protein [Eubacteriales bacterium OttesenSCG-928-M02]
MSTRKTRGREKGKPQRRNTSRERGGGRNSRNKRNAMWATLGVIVVLVMVLVGAAIFLWRNETSDKDYIVRLDDGRIHIGVTLDGIDVSGLLPAEAVAHLKKTLGEQEGGDQLILSFSNRRELLSLEAIGVMINLDGAANEAMKAGRIGGMDARMGELPAESLALKMDNSFDEAKLPELVRAALPTVNFAPVEPSATINPQTAQFDYVEGKPGIQVNEAELIQRICDAVKTGSREPIEVPGEVEQPKYSLESIKENTKKISSFSTTYDYKTASNKNRHFNINLMCEKTNGAVILPGETFSVNDTVGPRTDPKIWKAAPGLENGALTDQLGGGICQYSSTLYNSAVMADMGIVERRPHSVPSSYIAMGRDAVINTGGPDLKIKNNSDLPIYIIAYTRQNAGNAQKKDVVVELYGKPLADGQTISLEAKTVETIPHDPTPKIITDPKMVIKGRDGYVAELYKIYKDKNGKEIKREKVNTSRYNPASPRILQPVATPTPTPTPTAPAPATE